MLNEETVLKAMQAKNPDELYAELKARFGERVFNSIDQAYVEIAFKELINPETPLNEIFPRVIAMQWAAFASGYDLGRLRDE